MKRIIYLLLLCCIQSGFLSAQSVNKWMIPKEEFARDHDISELLKTDSLYGNNGIFDTNYSRLQMVFTSISKDSLKPLVYNVTGASRHKKVVTKFRGELMIDKVFQYPGGREIYKEDPERMVASDVRPEKMYTVIYGRARFAEDSSAMYSGVFMGSFQLKVHELKDRSLINDLREYEGMEYSNAIFKGQWRMYGDSPGVKFAFGEGRLPVPHGVDVGEKEFQIKKEYVKQGWQKDASGKYVDNPAKWWIVKPKK